MPVDLRLAVQIYPCSLDKIEDLLYKDFHDLQRYDKTSVAKAIDYLWNFHRLGPTVRCEGAAERLRRVNTDDRNFDRRFLDVSPSAIAVAIFHDVDLAFFNGKIAPHVRLEVEDPRLGDSYGLCCTTGRLTRIRIGTTYDREFTRGGSPRRGLAIRHLIACLCHEMVHAFLMIYTYPEDEEAWPARSDPDHNLAFCKALQAVQNKMNMAGWAFDLTDGGRFTP